MAGNLTAMIAAAFSGGAAPPVTSDPYFEYTTLLLPGNGTNGAQNNTFLDGSTNNFTITRNGNTTQGTFSPFSQTGWGNYFDGSNDYLTAPAGTAFAFGTGDFSVEAWVYLNATATSQNTIASTYANASSGFTFSLEGTGVLRVRMSGDSIQLSGSTVVSANTWHHVMVSRVSGTLRMFLNGNVDGSVADSTNSNNSSTAWNIGRLANASGYFAGYISNHRVIKGSGTSAAFTPSTSPLTAISGTSLLTCQSNRFIDNSSNNFTITANNGPLVVAFSPFNPSASWSAATYGGSGYFDGSGDYLTVPNNTALQLGTGDFEIDGWFYVSSLAASVILDARSSATASSYTLGFNSSGYPYIYDGSSSLTGSSGITAGQWNYVVWTKVSGTLRMFVNGTSVYSASNSSSLTGGGSNITICSIVSNGGQALNGYMSDLRIVKGSGITTSTVPTAPLTAITNTSLLLNFTNAGIYDATSKNDLETVGNAQISTAQSKWGGSSMAFDGTGDYLTTVSKQEIIIGTSTFTAEAWVYLTSSTTNQCIFGGSSANNPFALYINSSTQIAVDQYGTSEITFAVPTISLNAWYHVAVVRNSATTRVYLNGTESTTGGVSDSRNFSGATNQIGANQTSNRLLTGYIQDARITKGIARYTANFTPPTAAFPTL